jgi:hypothetical protein
METTLTTATNDEPTDDELTLAWSAFLARWPVWEEISPEEALVLDMEQSLEYLP